MNLICGLVTGFESGIVAVAEEVVQAPPTLWEVIKGGLTGGQIFKPKQDIIMPKTTIVGYMSDNIGKWVMGGGTIIEAIGILTILIGLFCVRFHHTKTLRWGFIIYLLGLLIEIIGIVLL